MIENQDKLLFNGVSIYVCSNQLTFFVENILPKLRYKFLLYSGDSIKTVPSEVLTPKLFVNLIKDDRLLLWFSQNNTVYDYPKIIQIPLGLDYHTIFNNPNHRWKKENEPSLPIQQEKILLDIIRDMKPFKKRKVKMSKERRNVKCGMIKRRNRRRENNKMEGEGKEEPSGRGGRGRRR